MFKMVMFVRACVRASVFAVCSVNHMSMSVSLICVSGKEEISVSKYAVLNVSAVAAACEESYRTGLPVQLSLSSDAFVNGVVEKSAAEGGEVVVDDVVKSAVIAQ